MARTTLLFKHNFKNKYEWLKDIPSAQAILIQNLLEKDIYLRTKEDLIGAGLLSADQADALQQYMKSLLTKNGIIGLALGFYDPVKLIELKEKLTADHFKELVSDNGAAGLKTGVITLEQAADMPYPIHLNKLFSRNSFGLPALSQELITCEQVATLDPNKEELWRLECLLSPQGFTLLMHQDITFEETAKYQNKTELMNEINNRLIKTPKLELTNRKQY